MRLTQFSKFLLALLVVGTVGYGLYLNRAQLGIRIPGLDPAASPGTRITSAPGTAAPPTDAARPGQNELVLEGSTAMTRLVLGWGKLLEAAQPGVSFRRGWGGTGRGISQLIAGAVDLTAASRPLKAKEEKLAADKGTQIKAHAVAIDAIAVIVNRRNRVTELTIQQLAGIYTGRITNWQEVGGESRPIVFYGREKTAGMYELFKEKALGNQDYSPKMRVARTTTEMLQAIAREPGAIGTATVAQSLKQKTAKLLGMSKSEDDPTIYPFLGNDLNARAIRNGLYPLTRELYLMSAGEPGGLSRDFIDIALGPPGQQVVRDEGYVPVR